MLHFREYGDFADYFGSRWHYYLGEIIAAIPMPFVFEGEFENGVATVMREFAKNRFRSWMRGEKENGRGAVGFVAEIHGIGFDESAEMRWQE